ncbi:MAG: DUF2933 domain-containing protein [Chloroflexi bacterium]|nr:DUF2933 domain-containing protein [Chloroflexota bacterium]
MKLSQRLGDAKHFLLMIACCLVPLVLILAVSLLGVSFGSLTALVPYAMVLICPLAMIWMMRQMGHEHGADESRQTPAAMPKGATTPVTASEQPVHRH